MASPHQPDRPRRRHRSFTDSHQEMIATAVRLISSNGVAALSIAALAREMNIDRTTIYYHFRDRDALVQEVKAWASAELTRAFSFDAALEERIDYTTRYVLEHPELVKLWIDEFISTGDIRESFPLWDEMIRGFEAKPGDAHSDVDAEIYFVNLLTSAIIGPRVFANRVNRDDDIETIVRKFRVERLRIIDSGA